MTLALPMFYLVILFANSEVIIPAQYSEEGCHAAGKASVGPAGARAYVCVRAPSGRQR